ncbi:MAG: hypothetical protein ACOYB8_00495 [Eubacteriaceae bacterium]|jgi:hypothetical protein
MSSKKQNSKQADKRNRIHTGYRIGALVLVIIMAVSLVAMYAF